MRLSDYPVFSCSNPSIIPKYCEIAAAAICTGAAFRLSIVPRIKGPQIERPTGMWSSTPIRAPIQPIPELQIPNATECWRTPLALCDDATDLLPALNSDFPMVDACAGIREPTRV